MSKQSKPPRSVAFRTRIVENEEGGALEIRCHGNGACPRPGCGKLLATLHSPSEQPLRLSLVRECPCKGSHLVSARIDFDGI